MSIGEGRFDAFQFLLPAIQKIPDTLERAAIVNDLAGYLGVEAGQVLEQFRRSALDRREMNSRERAAPPAIPAKEKLLVARLLAFEGVRAAILPRLKNLPGLEALITRRILENMIAMSENGAPFQFSQLDARLEAGDKALLVAIAFADEVSDESAAITQAEECVRTIERDQRARRIEALKTRIKQAERSGNHGEAMQLMEELKGLEQS